MVSSGQVPASDKIGNHQANDAAYFGRRRRVPEGVMDGRRHLSGVCGQWSPVVRDLHRFFVAVARVPDNDDDSGSTAVDLCVWCAGSVLRRKVKDGVRNFDLSLRLPPLSELSCSSAPQVVVRVGDVSAWPYSVG